MSDSCVLIYTHLPFINAYEMAGWHHWLDGRESQWTPGVGDGQGGLACCDSWGRRVGHEWATDLIWSDLLVYPLWFFPFLLNMKISPIPGSERYFIHFFLSFFTVLFFSVTQSRLTLWQGSLSFTISRCFLKLMSMSFKSWLQRWRETINLPDLCYGGFLSL